MPFRPTLRILSLLVATCGILAVTIATASLPPAAEEHLVDAGAYSLFFRVIRGEGPVVLLEAGGGADSRQWLDLAPRIARATGATVVSYDRPGFGGSDLPDLPCDMREESASMWRALAKLGLDENVFLAGHSYGGWMIRLHANDQPDKVAGLVFIDPFNCEFVDALGVDYCDRHPMMGNPPFKNTPPAELSRDQRALLRMVGAGLGPKMAIMRETRIAAGTPVRLLSSRQSFLPETHEQEAWWWAHERVVAAIPSAVLIEAAESGHGVAAQQPELVVQAIRSVIEEAARP